MKVWPPPGATWQRSAQPKMSMPTRWQPPWALYKKHTPRRRTASRYECSQQHDTRSVLSVERSDEAKHDIISFNDKAGQPLSCLQCARIHGTLVAESCVTDIWLPWWSCLFADSGSNSTTPFAFERSRLGLKLIRPRLSLLAFQWKANCHPG